MANMLRANLQCCLPGVCGRRREYAAADARFPAGAPCTASSSQSAAGTTLAVVAVDDVRVVLKTELRQLSEQMQRDLVNSALTDKAELKTDLQQISEQMQMLFVHQRAYPGTRSWDDPNEQLPPVAPGISTESPQRMFWTHRRAYSDGHHHHHHHYHSDGRPRTPRPGSPRRLLARQGPGTPSVTPNLSASRDVQDTPGSEPSASEMMSPNRNQLHGPGRGVSWSDAMAREEGLDAGAGEASNALSHTDLSCSDRLPRVGDFVYCPEQITTKDDSGQEDAWHLGPGEHATVVAVYGDGDLKLRNAVGVTSGWQARTAYKFCQEERAAKRTFAPFNAVPSSSPISPSSSEKSSNIGARRGKSHAWTPRSPRIKSVRPRVSLFTQSMGSSSHDLGAVAGVMPRTPERLTSVSSKGSALSVENTGGNRCRNCLRSVVEHKIFDWFVGLVIILNSALMGYQADAAAGKAHLGKTEPTFIGLLSTAFCIFFTVELLLRIAALGMDFVRGPLWKWNLFDTFVVGLQLSEEIVTAVASQDTDDGHNSGRTNLSFLRILRVLRLVRIVRVVRVLRVIRNLRKIVNSIANTVNSLFWTVMLLVLLIYVFGIWFTQMIADYSADRPGIVVEGTNAFRYFGSLGCSVLSLYQAITGGLDWKDLAEPVMETGPPFLMGAFFSLYIAFTILTVLNVITGVFVESALSSAHEKDRVEMKDRLQDVFLKTGIPLTGRLSKEDFQSLLEDPQLEAYFRDLDLSLEDAGDLFELLDFEGLGSIQVQEFINGCQRIRGSAKAVDLTTLMSEVRRMYGNLDKLIDFFNDRVGAGTSYSMPSVPFSPVSPTVSTPQGRPWKKREPLLSNLDESID